MDEQVKYISPSSFYYWEKCPLKAVFSKKYRGKQFFPNSPDADLGTIIHQFKENRIRWNIDSPPVFESKWSQLIEEINESYKSNELQKRYYPVQWHSKYYAVKKLLLKENLFSSRDQPKAIDKIQFEKWINNDVVGGKADRLVYNDEQKVRVIVDFKSGNIFEKADGKQKIKEIYQMQFALYAAVIKQEQGSYPDLYIENLKGERIRLELSEEYKEEIYQRAVTLKHKIEAAQKVEGIYSLAVVNNENCKGCNYRMVCTEYQTQGINSLSEGSIDLKGTIKKISRYENFCDIEIRIPSKDLQIMNLDLPKEIEAGAEVYIYNLYFPDVEKVVLYATKRTVVIWAGAKQIHC